MTRYIAASLGAALVALALLLALPAAGAADIDEAIVRLPSEPLVVETVRSGAITFAAEIADTDAERARGLMFRRSIGDREAMLFIWPQPHEVAMWMRNTYIPLDMLFITGTGRIVHIARNTTPHSLDVISANRDVLAVLEIGGGQAERLGIAEGDMVRHRYFNRQ